MRDEHTKIAIACQGGGSHTAFTAGALQRLLPEIARPEYDLIGFSGTSGGAICALLGWCGHVDPNRSPDLIDELFRTGRERAGSFLADRAADARSTNYSEDP